MNAQRMGFFSRDEFLRGLHLLGASTVDKLRKALPKLEEEVDSDPEAFGSFFTFAFRFCCTVRAPCLQTYIRLQTTGLSHGAALMYGRNQHACICCMPFQPK